jgi:hypothetical protein
MKRALLIVHAVCATLIATLIGCAVPAKRQEFEKFVERRELIVVALAREGASMLSQGRYSEAEGKLLQALWLSPESKTLKLQLVNAYIGSGFLDEPSRLLSEVENALPKEEPRMKTRTYTDQTLETPPYLVLTPAKQIGADLWQEVRDRRIEIALVKSNPDDEQRNHVVVLLREEIHRALQRYDYLRAGNLFRTLRRYFYTLGFEREALCFAEERMTLINTPESVLTLAEQQISGGFLEQAERLLALTEPTFFWSTDPRGGYIRALLAFERRDYQDAWSEVSRVVGDVGVDTTVVNALKGVLIAQPLVAETLDEEELESYQEEVTVALQMLHQRSDKLLLMPPHLVEQVTILLREDLAHD